MDSVHRETPDWIETERDDTPDPEDYIPWDPENSQPENMDDDEDE